MEQAGKVKDGEKTLVKDILHNMGRLMSFLCALIAFYWLVVKNFKQHFSYTIYILYTIYYILCYTNKVIFIIMLMNNVSPLSPLNGVTQESSFDFYNITNEVKTG